MCRVRTPRFSVHLRASSLSRSTGFGLLIAQDEQKIHGGGAPIRRQAGEQPASNNYNHSGLSGQSAGEVLPLIFGFSIDFRSRRVSAELRREVRQPEKGGVYAFNQFAIGFGRLLHGLPFGILAEGVPIGGGGLAAWVRRDIEEGPVPEGLIDRRPIGDVADSVLLEKLHGVLSKAAQQVVQLALKGVVHTKFVDGGRGLPRSRLLGTRKASQSPRITPRREAIAAKRVVSYL